MLLLSEPPAERHGRRRRPRPDPHPLHRRGPGRGRKAVAATDRGPPPVHVKVDTGMHRVGATAADVVKLALTIEERPELTLQGVWTHFAVADDPDRPLHRRAAGSVRRGPRRVGRARRAPAPRPRLQLGRAAGPSRGPPRPGPVRTGGLRRRPQPGPRRSRPAADLRPVLALKARVSLVKEVGPGEGSPMGSGSGPARPTDDRHRAHRLRRRRPVAADRDGRRGPYRGPPPPPRRRRHHGPAHGRLR